MLGCKGFKNMIGNFCKVLFILDSSQIWKLSIYSSRLLWMLSSKMCGHSILIHIWHCEVSHAHIRCNTTPYTAHALTLAIDNSWKKKPPIYRLKNQEKSFFYFWAALLTEKHPVLLKWRCKWWQVWFYGEVDRRLLFVQILFKAINAFARVLSRL